MSQLPRSFNQYKLLIWVAGLIVLSVAMWKETHRPHTLDEIRILSVFFFLIFAAELWPIKFPGSCTEFTMTMPVVVGAFLSLGPASTIIVTTFGVFAANVFAQRRRPLRWVLSLVAFNSSFYGISLACASVGYLLVGGRTLAQGGGINSMQMVVPLLMWVAICSTTNMLLFTTGTALLTGESWRMHARQNFSWYFPNYIVTAPSGILFAVLFKEYGIIGILLVVFPFLGGRQALGRHADQLDTYRETITTLGTYMQRHHAYTKGHLERVAEMSNWIARETRLAPQSLMFIRNAGLLHDIGKVGVNDDVLDKVGKLTDEEWEIIKQHPARGAEILSQMRFLDPIVPWVRGHHERPDGRGYPDGLVNGKIPIEASVIAVADAFDAMRGVPEQADQRVYKAPMSLDEAIDQVRMGAGTQFDGRVVRAFMRVMLQKEAEGDA